MLLRRGSLALSAFRRMSTAQGPVPPRPPPPPPPRGKERSALWDYMRITGFFAVCGAAYWAVVEYGMIPSLTDVIKVKVAEPEEEEEDPGRTVLPHAATVTQRAFFDVAIDGKPAGARAGSWSL